MSVRIGTPNRALMPASTRSPSSRPGPRNERPDVRLALSYDALKMKGTRARRAISARLPARSTACCSLSMTHGPAMSTNGLPPPIARSPSLTGVTALIIRGGWAVRSYRRSRDPDRTAQRPTLDRPDLVLAR